MPTQTRENYIPDFMPCQRTVGGFVGFDGEKVVSGALRCNQWTCPACRPRLKAALRRRILQGAICADGIPKYGMKFLTLTAGGAEFRQRFIVMKNGEPMFIQGIPQYNATAIYDEMIGNFHKLIKALRARYGKFHYFRVTETHLDGVPHFHVLLIGSAIIPKSILESIENLWRHKYGMGFVKLNTPKGQTGKNYFNDAKHAINYMLKYITKDVKQAGRYKRVFSASRGALVRKEKKVWHMIEVVMGRVDDTGIHEEKIEIDEHNLTEIPGIGGSPRFVKGDDVLHIILNRHVNNLVIGLGGNKDAV